ncbi:MAG: hypothetical protein L0G70_11205, partial [Rubrobacter sp.]|nr:hypothetical protein [Rubrobacter sp.]
MSGNGDLNHDPEGEDLRGIEDYLGSSAQDYGSLPGSEPDQGASSEQQQPKSPNNVSHDRFDARLYGELHEACEEIRNLEGREEAFETFPELLSDFFYSFYK